MNQETWNSYQTYRLDDLHRLRYLQYPNKHDQVIRCFQSNRAYMDDRLSGIGQELVFRA